MNIVMTYVLEPIMRTYAQPETQLLFMMPILASLLPQSPPEET